MIDCLRLKGQIEEEEMRGALIQLCSSDDPDDNLSVTRALVMEAADGGACFVLTPEVMNCVSSSRSHQEKVLRTESDDATLQSLCELALSRQIWLLLGSLALKFDHYDGKFVNRSFMISPEGEIVARYDKIHMFDVTISAEETYRESSTFRSGERAVVVATDIGTVGLSICYDVRFPFLYQQLALSGANILTIPAAFSQISGQAHWEVLLRSRAIETGCYVFAPAQTGTHKVQCGRSRRTHGHSMVVSPWGDVILDAEDKPGVYFFDWDDDMVTKARTRIPSLRHIRPFDVVREL